MVGGNHGLSLFDDAGDLRPRPTALHSPTSISQIRTRLAAPVSKNLTFVQIESNLSLVEIMSRCIESLWGIAKYRYTRAEGELPMVPGSSREFLRQIIRTAAATGRSA